MIGNTTNPRTQIILEPQLKLRLFALADQKNVSVSQMVREAVIKIYFENKRPKLINHPSFGAWKDVKKSDKQILKETGGNWKNFPLKF